MYVQVTSITVTFLREGILFGDIIEFTLHKPGLIGDQSM